MTPPPLPPGVEGEAVAPDVHTGCDEPERDSFEETKAEYWRRRFHEQSDRLDAEGLRALIAVTGLHELLDEYRQLGTLPLVVADISLLLNKIERAAR